MVFLGAWVECPLNERGHGWHKRALAVDTARLDAEKSGCESSIGLWLTCG